MQDNAMQGARKLILLSSLLFVSGFCALVFQVVWLREFRLVFGGSTPATAAVLAVFMGGLGAGNAILGRRADRLAYPLRYYANLEAMIALMAVLSLPLIDGIRLGYIALGGQSALGLWGASVTRILATAVVMGIPTFLMGGTLPAVVAAATTSHDRHRRALGFLYGANTLGGVLGTVASTFLLLPMIGTRSSLWLACLLNVGVAAAAWACAAYYAKGIEARETPTVSTPPNDRSSKQRRARSYAENRPEPQPVASMRIFVTAAVLGFVFMFMELVWFRMLAPLLGGTTYTFGVILAVVLLGIGVGGFFHPFVVRRWSPSPVLLAIVCGLEALAIAAPFAMGDRLALWSASLQQSASLDFNTTVAAWFWITAVVVLPASIISGIQFPLLISLCGKGDTDVGRQVGLVYAWNTFGGIAGSLAGGLGFLPLLSAPGAWRLVVVVLAATSLAWLWSRRDGFKPLSIAAAIVSVSAILLVALPTGPTAVWRHSGIGANRAGQLAQLNHQEIRDWKHSVRRTIVWQRDGVEAGVAIQQDDGISFLVNGKTDGNSLRDAGTQIMLGVLGAMMHDRPERALVVGLGTGESAGWLAALDCVGHVDVVEIEPALDEMAERCTPINHDVLRNPKVRRIYNDAREVLLTTRDRYDVIASEPSNPYRAGVADLFTQEFYQAARRRLNEDGIFIQWLQGYEVDDETVGTVLATLLSVFPHVEVWQSKPQDYLLVCCEHPLRYDAAFLEARLARADFRQAVWHAWHTVHLEGVLAHFVGSQPLVEDVAAPFRHRPNRDDHNMVEYGFARTLGRPVEHQCLRTRAVELRADRPQSLAADDAIDWTGVEDERVAWHALLGSLFQPPSTSSPDQQYRIQALHRFSLRDPQGMLDAWGRQPQAPRYATETVCLAVSHALNGDDRAVPLIDQFALIDEDEANLVRAIYLWKKGQRDRGAGALCHAFVRLRDNPWPVPALIFTALEIAKEIAIAEPHRAPALLESIDLPFAVGCVDSYRLDTAFVLAQVIRHPRVIAVQVEKFEPHVPWTREFLALRLQVYEATGHSLLSRARDDLSAFESSARAANRSP